MNIIIVIIESVAFLFWVLAFRYSRRLYKKTFYATTSWFFIGTAVLFLGLASLTNIVQWLDIFPDVSEELQEIFVGIASFALVGVVLSHYRERKLYEHLEYGRKVQHG